MSVVLSLIVPAYNVAPYLEECIDSIVANAYQNYEILLIDDGSTDETGAICDILAQKYKKIKVFHTENRGLCAARNLGLENANGKYIGFVDSDDLVAPDMLEALVSNMTDDIQMVACGFVRCKRTDTPIDDPSSQSICKTDIQETAHKVLLDGYGSNVWNKIYRKSVLDDHSIRFRTNIMVAEDQYFLMDFLPYCERAVFLDRPLYYYVMNDGSIMNTFRQNQSVPAKYVGLPYAWAYSAEVVRPLSKELTVYAQSRAAMFYQTVLRKLEKPSPEYIAEAVAYVRKYKAALLRYRWGWKYYLSAVILSINYKLWASIFRRNFDKR